MMSSKFEPLDIFSLSNCECDRKRTNDSEDRGCDVPGGKRPASQLRLLALLSEAVTSLAELTVLLTTGD